MIACRSCGRAQADALCAICRAGRYRGQTAARRLWAPIIAIGRTECSRSKTDPECPGVIDPADDWDLDHMDGTRHPAHSACNRRAGARSQ